MNYHYNTIGSGKQGLFWEETRAPAGHPGLWISLWIMLITGSLGSLGVLVGQEPNNSVYLAP